ncbi:MAG: aspartate carbamoyltransferase catalytic subunit, partial [Clostridiales bacterium]|nr:aspartate carbamoyltransferase catalytic subunit [Clostridiales bacterium]
MKKYNDLLGLSGLSREELYAILARARDLKAGGAVGTVCAGRSVFLMFYENSTRTSSSFDVAARRMGATSICLAVKASSVNKGESLCDTGRTLAAMGADVLVMRHSLAGAPHLLAKEVGCAVINAGDGQNEHPTQALLDFMTLQERFGADLKGLRVAIVGDIRHSRVARSNVWGLKTLGAEVVLCAPQTLLPASPEAFGVTVERDVGRAVAGADAVIALRMQRERQEAGLVPSVGEYRRFYGITPGVLKGAAPHVVVLHPGPVNRGVELSDEVLSAPYCLMDTQVTNGVYVRMAV